MVNYRVHYDDSLGTSPDIKGVAELVVRRKGHDVPDASLVMIRISNEGGLDIGREHWVLPISFTFDGRDVVGVEVSDAGHVPAGLLTGDQEQEPPGADDSDAAGGVGVLQATVTEGERAAVGPDWAAKTVSSAMRPRRRGADHGDHLADPLPLQRRGDAAVVMARLDDDEPGVERPQVLPGEHPGDRSPVPGAGADVSHAWNAVHDGVPAQRPRRGRGPRAGRRGGRARRGRSHRSHRSGRRGERPDQQRETAGDRGHPHGRDPAGPPQSHISVSATGEASGNDAAPNAWLRFRSWTTCTRPSSSSS